MFNLCVHILEEQIRSVCDYCYKVDGSEETTGYELYRGRQAVVLK